MPQQLSFQLSLAVAHEAISSLNDQDFDAMMQVVMAEHDPKGVMASLTKGHITEKYAAFFSDFAPLPVVVDPWVDITQDEEFLDIAGIPHDEAERLSADYVQHPGPSDVMVAMAVSETIEATLLGSETKLVFDGESLCGEIPRPRPFRHPDMPQPDGAPLSGPDPPGRASPVPIFELLPGTGMAYAAIVDHDTIVVGRTPEIAVARARTDYNSHPHSHSRAMVIGRVGGYDRVIGIYPPDRFGGLRVPDGTTVGLADYVAFVRRSLVMTVVKLGHIPEEPVPPT